MTGIGSQPPAQGAAVFSAPAAGAPQPDDARQLAATVVHAVYRLVKGCLLHAESNQAVTQLVDSVVSTVDQYCRVAHTERVSILFAAKTVFVNRQMLKASKETYALALELGAMFQTCDFNELTLSHDMTAGDASLFGGLVANAQRDNAAAGRLRSTGFTGIRVRTVTGFGGAAHDNRPIAKAARTYAASVMIVRAFFKQLRAGKYELPHGVKRIAQKLVTHAEEDGRLLVAIAAAPPADADRSGLAVSSAILSLAMASQLTRDRTPLASLVSAALLYDAGQPRLVAAGGTAGIERQLSAQEMQRLPASATLTLTALGKLHPPSITRGVIAYEALCMRVGMLPYDGRRTPSVLSRVLTAARYFCELRLPDPTSGVMSIDDALQVMSSQAADANDRTFVKLLTGALGIFPAGTMVELNTGEMGVVVSTPAMPVDFAQPPIRILYDANANLLDEPIDIDLAGSRGAGPLRLIQKVVDADDQQFKQMRAYVASLVANRQMASSRRSKPPQRARSAPPPSSGVPSSQQAQSSRTMQGMAPAASPPVALPNTDALATNPPPAPAASSTDHVATDRPPSRQAISLSSSDIQAQQAAVPSSKPRVRPAARRRDPRMDDDEPMLPQAELAGPASVRPQARSRTSPQQQAIQPPPPPPPVEDEPDPSSTRSANWDTYGAMVRDSRSQPAAMSALEVQQGAPPAGYAAEPSTPGSGAPVADGAPAADELELIPMSDTDALLADFLAGGDAPEPAPASPAPAPPAPPGPSSHPPASGSRPSQHPDSGGLKWDKRAAQGADAPGVAGEPRPPLPSSPPRSGGLRWGEKPGGGPDGKPPDGTA